jgi:hypothetical protein
MAKRKAFTLKSHAFNSTRIRSDSANKQIIAVSYTALALLVGVRDTLVLLGKHQLEAGSSELESAQVVFSEIDNLASQLISIAARSLSSEAFKQFERDLEKLDAEKIMLANKIASSSHN